MKKFVLLLIFIASLHSFCQQKVFYNFKKDTISNNQKDNLKGEESQVLMFNDDSEKNEPETSKSAKARFGSISENISFGLSLGFNNTLENLKLAQISPIDQKVIISNAQKTHFVLSTAISIPISFNKNKFFRYTNNKGNGMGQIHEISEWSIIGIVNLLTFNGAESGEVFNQKLSGGLGLSYSFSPDFSIGLSYELISYRKPKNFLINLEGQEVQSNGETLNTIEVSDNNYYFDRYASTLSLKVIYKLTKS